MQSTATAIYTLEQYLEETAESRRKSFLDKVLAVMLIFIGTIGLFAVI